MKKTKAKISVKEIERLGKFADVCRKIYIARNITFSEKDFIAALNENDSLLRERNEN